MKKIIVKRGKEARDETYQLIHVYQTRYKFLRFCRTGFIANYSKSRIGETKVGLFQESARVIFIVSP